MHLRPLTTIFYWYYIWVYMMFYNMKIWLRCQILKKVLMWRNNDWCTRLLFGSSSPRTRLTGEGGNNGMSVLLAAMQHASACWSWHLLMLLDSHLWILLGSDSSLKNYFLDSWLKHGPILLLQGSVVSHDLWTVLLLSSSWTLTGKGCRLAPHLSSHPSSQALRPE